VVSPVTGVVLTRHISNQRVLPAGEPLLEIGDMQELEIEVDILSVDAMSVRQGQEVEIYSPSHPDLSLKGRVQRVFPQAFTKLSSLGVEQQRVKVVVNFEANELDRLLSSNHTIGAGYRLRVRILTNQRSNTLVVPRSSVFQSTDGSWRLLRIADGVIESVPVKLGLINDEQVEVIEGVEAGQSIVVVPDSSLEPGTRVMSDVVHVSTARQRELD